MKKVLLTLGTTTCLSMTSFNQTITNETSKINSHAIYLRTMDAQAADLNKDGYIDLVLALEWAPNAILWGSKEGTFSDNHLMKLSNNLYDSEDVAIADFNNDGLLDLAFGAEDDQNHELYLNQGNGKFIEIKNKFPKFTSNALIACDINQDGAMDLIFGNAGQNRIFINDGKANFSDETNLRFPADSTITQDLIALDVDLDGDMDLVVANEDGNEIWINQGDGKFVNQTDKYFPKTNVSETRKVIAFDANNDGQMDLYFCNVSDDETKKKQDFLFINDGRGYFNDATSNLPNIDLGTLDAAAIDINKDGHLDLVLGFSGKHKPVVLQNNGKGAFTIDETILQNEELIGNYITVLPYDFNKDGKKDLYFGGFMTGDQLFYGK